MIAVKCPEVKEFMNHLLRFDTFDDFELVEATVMKDYTVTLDGKLNREYYTEEERQERGLSEAQYIPYGDLRPVLFEHIKGKRTPLLMKLTLSMPKEKALGLLRGENFSQESQISQYLLQIRYDGNGLYVTTGVNYTTFSMEKNLEHEWDHYVPEFLKSQGIYSEG